MMMRLALPVLWLGSLAAGGCLPGSGKGSVDGTLFIRECAEHQIGAASGKVYSYGTPTAPAPYSMHPSFFAAEPVNDFERLYPDNRLNIRIQSDGSRVEEADVLYVNIASDYVAAQMLGQAIPVGPTTNIRASLNLNQSCPDPEVVPTLEGSITFSEFGKAGSGSVPTNFNINLNDHLTAMFQFNIVDVRAATLGGQGAVSDMPAVGGALSGFFDFAVREGQSAQAYP